MSQKLRVICPLSIICLALLVFSAIRMDSNSGASASSGADLDTAVTYEEAWDRMAEPTTARESTAAQHPTHPPVQELGDGEELFKLYEDQPYALSDGDRAYVERIVMCEAGGESVRGQMMVAQCIKEGLIRYDYSMDEYIDNYQVMLTSYSNVTDEVRESVSRVFDDGERVTVEKADLWYNPALVQSKWHEEQQYVTTIGSHRFFYMIDEQQMLSD